MQARSRPDLCCRKSILSGVEYRPGAGKVVNIDIDMCASTGNVHTDGVG